MSSTSRRTTDSTGRSEPLQLVSWVLETHSGDCRLVVTGGPVRGVCQTHSWRFTSKTLGAALLSEIEASSAALAQSALLSAVGSQAPLSEELDGLTWPFWDL